MALLGKGAPGTNAAQRPAHKAAAATKRRERRPIIFDSVWVLIGREGCMSRFHKGSIAMLLSEYQTRTRATRQAGVVVACPSPPDSIGVQLSPLHSSNQLQTFSPFSAVDVKWPCQVHGVRAAATKRPLGEGKARVAVATAGGSRGSWESPVLRLFGKPSPHTQQPDRHSNELPDVVEVTRGKARQG